MASLENIDHYLRKYKVFTLIQTCENVELTVSKNCDPLFSPHDLLFSFSMGTVDPSEENPCKITVALKSVSGNLKTRSWQFSFGDHFPNSHTLFS